MSDKRLYAEWWELTIAFLMAFVIIMVLSFMNASEIRDLQRRIAELETKEQKR